MGINNMLAFALFSIISVASGLYFHIGETEKKCFIEEIPDETMVVGKLCTTKLKIEFEEAGSGALTIHHDNLYSYDIIITCSRSNLKQT
jgi:hypothetical protein